MTRLPRTPARRLAALATTVAIAATVALPTLGATTVTVPAPGRRPAPASRPAPQPATRPAARPAEAARPSLIVLIAVDQFRADYLTRWAPQLTGGLPRLMRGGAWFTDAHQDHGITETAPGHASMLSGRFPRSTGIMMNSIGVLDESAPLVANGYGDGASPKRFLGTTLADWMRAADGKTRTLSVSMKDRAAILPNGRAPSDVYWYSPDGRFITSTYYRKALPAWVEAFNDKRMPASFAGKAWTLLLPDSAYHEPDSVAVEGNGRQFLFPHPMTDDAYDAGNLVRAMPYIDDIVAAFAIDGVRALELGASATRTDLLTVSLSATDVIGHRYGPDSREIHDQVLRVDRVIGRFLDSLYAIRDSSTVTVVFTSDHGVGSIPEIAAKTVTPRPQRVNLDGLYPAVRAQLRAAKIDTMAFWMGENIVQLDRAPFRNKSLSPDSVLASFAAAARLAPGVARVDRFKDLVADSAKDPIARRWSHQFPADVNVDLIITLTPMSTWGGNVASHGSPYDYDSHVPLIFSGFGIKAGKYPDFVRIVDIAPTLAVLDGVKPLEKLDGVPLKAALGAPAR